MMGAIFMKFGRAPAMRSREGILFFFNEELLRRERIFLFMIDFLVFQR